MVVKVNDFLRFNNKLMILDDVTWVYSIKRGFTCLEGLHCINIIIIFGF